MKWKKLISALIFVALISSGIIVYESNLYDAQNLTIVVNDSQGYPLKNVYVQGFMLTPPGYGETFETVFVTQTNQYGQAFVTDLSNVKLIANEWINYDKANNKNYTSLILLFLTYNDSGKMYFKESSIYITAQQIIQGKSGFALVTMDLSKGEILYVQKNGYKSSNIGQPLPKLESAGYSDYWVQQNYTLVPSNGFTKIPLGWVEFAGSAGGVMGSNMAVTIISNTGIALNPYSSTQVSYQPGAQAFSANGYVGSIGPTPLGNYQYSVGSEGYDYVMGQIELALYELYYYDPSTYKMYPLNEYMLQGGVVYIETNGSNIDMGFSTGLPASYSSIMNNFTYQLYTNNNGTGSNLYDLYSYELYQGSVNWGTWVDIALAIGGIAITFVAPPLWGIGYGVISGIIGAFSFGSTTNAYVFVDVGYNAPSNYLIDVFVADSNFKLQVNNQNVSIPIMGVYIIASQAGGGCVAYGTKIALYNGSQIPVQELKPGMKILSYDPNTGKLFEATVVKIEEQKANYLLNINNQLLLSGFADQPIFVKLPNGKEEWIAIGKLSYSMQIYDPLNNSWIPIKSLSLEIGNFTVFNVVAAKQILNGSIVYSDYIANNILLDMKTP